MQSARRSFLRSAAGFAVALRSRHARAQPRGSSSSRVVPFLDEGAFPVAKDVGAGLGRRRAIDLAPLGERDLAGTAGFFVRTAAPERLQPASSWRILVSGLVQSPVEISAARLAREARDRGAHLIECAGNARAAHFGLVSAARFHGVPVVDVISRARALDAAKQLLVSGFDEHAVGDSSSVPGASWVFDLETIRASGAFLATGMNGRPLEPDHGAPVRLVVPGWYGCTAIKWVNEIVFVDADAPATAQMKEFAGRTHQKPLGPRDEELMRSGQRPEGPALAREFAPALIDPVAVPIRVEERVPGKLYRIVGLTWGGRTRIRGLAIRFDESEAFAPVERLGDGPPTSWRLWSHTFRPSRQGRYRVELRVDEPEMETIRLGAGFYAREFEVGG